jgi:hypothetical protein
MQILQSHYRCTIGLQYTRVVTVGSSSVTCADRRRWGSGGVVSGPAGGRKGCGIKKLVMVVLGAF